MDIDKEKYIESLKERGSKNKKIDFEFQDLGVQMVDCFGKKNARKIWPLFYKPEYTLGMIRDSFIAYKKQPVISFNYFMGILNTKAGKKKKR